VLVLGIDPGSRVLGYGLISWGASPRFIAGGAISAAPRAQPGARLAEIGQDLDGVLRELQGAHKIERVAIEAGFFGRAAKSNPKTDLVLANARGVALFLVATILGKEPAWLAPATVKKAVTGSGRAEKAEVQRAVVATLKMRRCPAPDVADALAVAIAAACQSPSCESESQAPTAAA